MVATFDLAAPAAFYSPDHPRIFADSPDAPRVFASDQPEFSPWIDFPADLDRYGFVGICYDGDTDCLDNLARLAPGAERLDVTLAREVAGMRAKAWTNVAPRAAKTMSQASARLAPAPAATPLTAHTTGIAKARSLRTSGW